MNSFLLFNIGNTHTQWVRSDLHGVFTEVGEVTTTSWQENISLLPEADGDSPVWASCVVPRAREHLSRSGYYKNLHFVDPQSAAAAGVDLSLVDTSTLGADRIANAVALLQYDLPAANFDFGTAITLEIVLADKKFAGGAIMPGRKLMRQALNRGTAALPEVPLDHPLPENPGVNTLQALALGIDRGAVGMTKELMSVAGAQGVKIFTASGGDAKFFCEAIKELVPVEKTFTLRGVYHIAAKHLEKELIFDQES